MIKRHGKQIWHDGTPIADARTEANGDMIVAALCTSPVIDFQRATEIGRELVTYFGTKPRMDEFGMADAVQFVLRRARDIEGEREG